MHFYQRLAVADCCTAQTLSEANSDVIVNSVSGTNSKQ